MSVSLREDTLSVRRRIYSLRMHTANAVAFVVYGSAECTCICKMMAHQPRCAVLIAASSEEHETPRLQITSSNDWPDVLSGSLICNA